MLQSQSPQILPSPARLGLSNAPSPSLPNNPNPNPNPNSKPSSLPSSSSQQQSQTSNVLLSLLPPLPRAQSLLQQMASLSTALFEVSPNRSIWSSFYRGNLPTFLTTTTTTTTSSTKELLSLFTSLQSQLFASIAELQEILDLQDSTAAQSRHISSSDSSLLSFAKNLKHTERALDRLVDDYDYSEEQRTQSKKLDLDSLLACAHRVSYTTFAPPDHAASGAPLRAALPPAPQDNEMRASQLYLFADLDVGIPKKVADVSGKEENAVAEAVLMDPTPTPPPRPMLPISVPEGWRKGMPAMPPGWKPGDPVPLPPMGAGREELRVPALPVPKTQEPFLVKHVQLDINPDEEEYTSDSSSEVGSEDEDDED